MMKPIKYKSSWKLLSLLAFFCIPAFTGCNQYMEEVSDETISDSSDNSRGITVSLDGIEGYVNAVSTRSDIHNAGGDKEPSVIQVDTIEENGLVVKTELIAEPMEEVETRAITDFKNAALRVVAFKGTTLGGEIAGTAVFKISNTGVVTTESASPALNGKWLLDEGVYSFVFYSYGTAEVPPAITKENKTISLYHDDGFLIARKENVKVSYDSNRIFQLSGITLSQQYTKVSIDLTVKIFGDNIITACEGHIGGAPNTPYQFNVTLKNFIQGDYPQNGAGVYRKFTFSGNKASYDFILLPWKTSTYGGISIYNLQLKTYSVDGSSISYKNIRIGDYSRQFSSRKHYRYRVELLGRGEKYFLGKVWAGSNLVRVSEGAHRFARPGEKGSYYAWNSTTTRVLGDNSSTYSNKRDPCYYVEQNRLGRWRTPSEDDFRALINNVYIQLGYFDEISQLTGAFFTGTGSSKESIFLPNGGYYDGSSYVSTQHAYIWTSDMERLDGTYKGKAITSAYDLPGRWPKARIPKGNLMQVRCIRDID